MDNWDFKSPLKKSHFGFPIFTQIMKETILNEEGNDT